jgi:hypothetical protein
MSNINIRLADDRDFQHEVSHLVRLLRCPVAFLEAVQVESQAGISYAQAFERVEAVLEEKTGLRHYPEGGYGAFRVQKHRIQTRKISEIQLSLFK